MLNSIEGRSVIVTGASKGIEKGIAKVFAAKGARVLVVARNIGPAEATANEYEQHAATPRRLRLTSQAGRMRNASPPRPRRNSTASTFCARMQEYFQRQSYTS